MSFVYGLTVFFLLLNISLYGYTSLFIQSPIKGQLVPPIFGTYELSCYKYPCACFCVGMFSAPLVEY